MGFLDIFRKKESEKLPIRLDEIEPYLSSKLTLDKSSIAKKIEQQYSRIRKEMSSISENLNALSIADIRDKVPDKARVKVLGNRDAYVLAMNNFLANLHVPEVIDQEMALNFCNDLMVKLTSFSESTKKNFYITEQLLGVELEKITQNLRVLFSISNELKSELEKENLVVLKNLRQRMSSIKEKKSRLADLNNRIKDLESKLAPFVKVKHDVESDMKRMKESSEYEYYGKLSREKSAIERKMSQLDSDLKELFSQLSRVIKKYNKSKHLSLLDLYLEKPLDALILDTSQDILYHSAEIIAQIEKDEIQLKGKLKEKTIKQLQILTQEYIKNTLSQHQDFKSQYMNIKSKMFSSRLAEEEMRLSSRLESASSNIKLYETDIQQLRKIMEKLDMEEDKRVISNLMTKLTNKEFTVVFD